MKPEQWNTRQRNDDGDQDTGGHDDDIDDGYSVDIIE